MPTLLQLPQARTVSASDEVLLQQGTQTRAVTVANLLAGTQPVLTLAPNALLGRVSALPGGPESVVIGPGLELQSGTLAVAPVTFSGDITGGGSGSINVALPAIMAGGTFTKMTVNAKGQVVNGDYINRNDVTAALGFSPYSTANPAGYLTASGLSAYAPLASPSLTGTPLAPTPVPSDSSGAIATTAFVQAHNPSLTISGDVVGTGAGTLSLRLPVITTAGNYTKVTVNAKGQVTGGAALASSDVAGALGFTPYSNANPNGYVGAAALAGLAPLASPALSGTPTAPTPPVSDNSTAIATTAFVQAHTLPTTLTGDVTGSGTGTVAVTLPAIVTAGSYAKVTVNAKGQVTSGGTLAAADVAGALGFTPYSNANPAGYTTPAGLTIFPVVAYGAFFDGVHDDQPGIMAAIAAAHAAGGGVVLLPAASGTLANTVVQPYSHVQLVGAGGGQAYDIATGSYVSATVLTWTGAAGGTMLSVGPAQNTASGRPIDNADIRGIMFECANKAGVGVAIASTNKSKIDLCYANPLQCGLRFTTVWLKAQTSATDSIEINDAQHNEISVQGICINSTASTVATAVPSGGSTSVTLASGAGFVAGMQVKIGNGLYILAAVSGNVATTTTPVTQSDGTAGNAVKFFPRGVWLHASTVDTIPAGLNSSFLSTTYPLAWNGNVSMNQFRSVVLIHYTAGDAFVFGYSDHNFVDKLTVYCNTGANGVLFDGSNIAGGASAQNRIEYCSAGQITARGTTSFTTASTDGYIGYLDTFNGASFPIVETGATVHVRTDTDLHYAAKLVTPVIYEAPWEPITGTYKPAHTTSLTIVNNVSDHVRLATALNTAVWSVTINGSNNNLQMSPLVGNGALVVSAAMTVSGSLAVAGTLTAPTAAATDSSNTVATTAWVSGRGYVLQVATLAQLRSYPTSGLANGVAVLVDSYASAADNGGGLFTWSAAATAADNSGTVVTPTGNTAAGRWTRLLNGQRATPQMFGAKGDGATDDTAAFNAALASGPVYVPPAIYVIANVTVPNGALIEGDVGLGYSGDIAQGTPTGIQQLTPVRPILLAKAGSTSCVLNVSGNIDAIIKGVFIDGGANTPTCDGISAGSTRLTLERCTVVRCVNGLGSQTGTTLYTNVATIIDCEFANNTNGVSNLVDSVMMAGAVSANVTGVNLGSGANANNFIGVRFEWNYQDGLQGYAASSNQVVGGLFDRNAWRAVNLGTGCSDWTFTGVQFARNGSNNVYPNNSHIALNGSTSVFFTGCISRTGKNDDNTGTLSPAYFVNYINTNALVTISGCDVSGYITGFSFGANPTSYVQRDNDGGGDTIVTAARPFIGNGVSAQTLVAKAATNITPGQNTTIQMGQSPLTSNYSVTGRELVVTASNFNAPYQSCSARFNLAFYRDTTVHAPSSSSAYGEAGGSGIVTWGGSGKLQLSAASVAADGSAWTLGIANGGASDGSNWGVWAELR